MFESQQFKPPIPMKWKRIFHATIPYPLQAWRNLMKNCLFELCAHHHHHHHHHHLCLQIYDRASLNAALAAFSYADNTSVSFQLICCWSIFSHVTSVPLSKIALGSSVLIPIFTPGVSVVARLISISKRILYSPLGWVVSYSRILHPHPYLNPFIINQQLLYSVRVSSSNL